MKRISYHLGAPDHPARDWLTACCLALVVSAMGCAKQSGSPTSPMAPLATQAPEPTGMSLSDTARLDNTWRVLVQNGDSVLTEKPDDPDHPGQAVRSHETFLLMDENGDGKVTRDEFGTLEKRESMLLEKPDKKTLWLIGIIDSDTKDQKLSRDEWNSWIEPPQRPYFDKIDLDKDGLITMAELKRFASPHR